MERNSLLLVEGDSDKQFVETICKLHKLSTDFEIKKAGSITSLKSLLKVQIKSTQIYSKIWVIIDADTNFDSAWQSIRDILIRSDKYRKLNNNTALSEGGIVVNPDNSNDIVIGVWIMPNNSDIGMLEDFLANLISKDDLLYKKSIETIDSIEENRKDYTNLYKEVHKSKAILRTWLAWQDEPGLSITVAIRKKIFDINIELCEKFILWLKKLN